MDLGKYLTSPWYAWGLVILLMAFLGVMAYLKRSELVKERTAVFVIALIFLLVVLALVINIQ
jgi:uncharacterized iron-regulated membrane protein